jgi:hypothetical protein
MLQVPRQVRLPPHADVEPDDRLAGRTDHCRSGWRRPPAAPAFSVVSAGRTSGTTTQTDTSSTAQFRQVAGAAERKARARSPSIKTAYPSAFSQCEASVPDQPNLRANPDRASHEQFHASRSRSRAGTRDARLRIGTSVRGRGQPHTRSCNPLGAGDSGRPANREIAAGFCQQKRR